MSNYNQNIETTCNSKLKFTELKDLYIYIYIYIYIYSNYVANTVYLKLQIFRERCHFRLLIFASIGEYFY